MRLLLIYVIFLFAFFGDSLVDYRLIPTQVTLATEASIYLLFIYSLVFTARFKTKRYSCHLWYPYSYFLAVTFGSIIINNYFSLQPLFSLRLILRFYVFYLALTNIELDDTFLRKTNKLLFILFIIQIAMVAYKFIYRGISEDTIGTYGTHGGGLTAIIPIVALGYLAGYFTFYRARFSYVLLAIGFILLGIAGQKRALLFIYPIAFMGIYFLTNIIGKKGNVIKKFGVLACVGVLSIAVSAVIIKYHKGYNYNSEGTVDYARALEYAGKYTTNRIGNVAGGRVATTLLAFELSSKAGNLIFGFGPGSLTKSVLGSRSDSRLKFIYRSYGLTGSVFILIEYGLMGVIAFVLIFLTFAYRCWQWFKYEEDPYWKAFAMGALVFAVHITFIFFCYNLEPLLGDVIPPVYFYAMAVTHIRMKEITKSKGDGIKLAS